MKTRKHIVLLGCGYSAKALIPKLKTAGFRITASSTTPAGVTRLKALGTDAILFNGNPEKGLSQALTTATHLISSIPPDKDGDPALRNLDPDWIMSAPKLRWAAYLSATSVYGDRNGHWVFEDELLRPSNARGRARVLAELDWCESGAPVHIFRIAGIYGPNIDGRARNAFARIRAGAAQAICKPGHISNRIHVADIGTALLASMKKPDPLMIYNLADDTPAPPQDVLNFAAKMIGISIPQVDFDKAEMSDMARSFYHDQRRTSNTRAHSYLDWSPRYASYKEGLVAILKKDG